MLLKSSQCVIATGVNSLWYLYQPFPFNFFSHIFSWTPPYRDGSLGLLKPHEAAIKINQNLKTANLNHWKETINFHISYADFAKELTDLFFNYLLYLWQWLLINTAKTINQSKYENLLPPWKEFKQKNWKFQKKKQELWRDNRQWNDLMTMWSEVKLSDAYIILKRVNTWQFWPKLMNLWPSINIKLIIILQCNYKKIKIYIYEKKFNYLKTI